MSNAKPVPRKPLNPRYRTEQIAGTYTVKKYLGRRDYASGPGRTDKAHTYAVTCNRCASEFELSQQALRAAEREKHIFCANCRPGKQKSPEEDRIDEEARIRAANDALRLWRVPPSSLTTKRIIW